MPQHDLAVCPCCELNPLADQVFSLSLAAQFAAILTGQVRELRSRMIYQIGIARLSPCEMALDIAVLQISNSCMFRQSFNAQAHLAQKGSIYNSKANSEVLNRNLLYTMACCLSSDIKAYCSWDCSSLHVRRCECKMNEFSVQVWPERGMCTES